MNNVKANKKPSNIVLLRRIAFSQSRQPAWQLQSQNFQNFSQQFHPQTYSGLKCVPITWWMKCPTLFGKLQRAILDLHQKEGTHSCSICNVYLWFTITSGCGEINCCSLLCFKTPIETLQISFYPFFFFFFFFPFLVKMWTKKIRKYLWINTYLKLYRNKDCRGETEEIMKPLQTEIHYVGLNKTGDSHISQALPVFLG